MLDKDLNMSDFTNMRLAALKNVVFTDTYESENNFKCFLDCYAQKIS